MLFLAHKLRCIVQRCLGADSAHGRHALRVEDNIARRWISRHAAVDTKQPLTAMADILGEIEAMHVLRRLFDTHAESRFASTTAVMV